MYSCVYMCVCSVHKWYILVHTSISQPACITSQKLCIKHKTNMECYKFDHGTVHIVPFKNNHGNGGMKQRRDNRWNKKRNIVISSLYYWYEMLKTDTVLNIENALDHFATPTIFHIDSVMLREYTAMPYTVHTDFVFCYLYATHNIAS